MQGQTSPQCASKICHPQLPEAMVSIWSRLGRLLVKAKDTFSVSFFFLILVALSSMQDLSSPTRNRTCTLCGGRSES